MDLACGIDDVLGLTSVHVPVSDILGQGLIMRLADRSRLEGVVHLRDAPALTVPGTERPAFVRTIAFPVLAGPDLTSALATRHLPRRP